MTTRGEWVRRTTGVQLRDEVHKEGEQKGQTSPQYSGM